MANRVRIKHDFEVGDIVRYAMFSASRPEYEIGTYGIVIGVNNNPTRFRRKNAGVMVHWQTPPKFAPDSLEYITEIYFECLIKAEDFPAQWEKYNCSHGESDDE